MTSFSGSTDMLPPKRISILTLLLALACGLILPAQDPKLKDTFQQAKELWMTQGDRDGAAEKFEAVLTALEPQASALGRDQMAMLCEAYNWMAILDDRSPAQRARVPKHLESLVDLAPDFDVDRHLTPARIQGIFDGLRAAKLARLHFNLEPAGGQLRVDGKPAIAVAPYNHLPIGKHTLSYGKPGFLTLEKTVELAPKSAQDLAFQLVRASSTVTLYTRPVGTEILLDGKSLGRTRGQAPPEIAPLAEKAGIPVGELSEALVVAELKPGKHLLECSAPCFRTRRIEIGEELTRPFADHVLEPIKLEPARGMLTVASPWPGGELFLSGEGRGALPVKDLPVCPGAYDLLVKFQSGAFAQRIEIQDGKPLALSIAPKPRLAYVGFEGDEEFPGRSRLLAQLAALGGRLKELVFVSPPAAETPQEILTRLHGTRGAELLLRAHPVAEGAGRHVELSLLTPDGEEDRFTVNPAAADPLGPLVDPLNTRVELREPWAGLTLLDVPGEPGPFVLQATPEARKAGIQLNKPVLQANGKPLPSVAAFRRLLRETSESRITVVQEGAPIALVLAPGPLEIPHAGTGLSYVALLAELRLRSLGATGDEAAALRLNQAIALMHFRQYERAVEVLRETRFSGGGGLGQATVDYYLGICLQRLGGGYTPESTQAFSRAAKAHASTFSGPDGPSVAPFAKQCLEDLKP